MVSVAPTFTFSSPLTITTPPRTTATIATSYEKDKSTPEQRHRFHLLPGLTSRKHTQVPVPTPTPNYLSSLEQVKRQTHHPVSQSGQSVSPPSDHPASTEDAQTYRTSKDEQSKEKRTIREGKREGMAAASQKGSFDKGACIKNVKTVPSAWPTQSDPCSGNM